MIDAGGFGIDALEVSRGDYAAFLADNVDVAAQSQVCVWNDSFEPQTGDVGGCQGFDMAQSTLPIVCVDWCDAAAYCAWAGKRMCRSKSGGTLAHEDQADAAKSEWFSACSASGTRTFPYGNTETSNACNTFGNGSALRFVGGFPECEGGVLGLFDMVGNATEWEDACRPYMGEGPDQDRCLIRGGAFWSDHTTTNENFAQCAGPVQTNPRSYYANDRGFRCCSDL